LLEKPGRTASNSVRQASTPMASGYFSPKPSLLLLRNRGNKEEIRNQDNRISNCRNQQITLSPIRDRQLTHTSQPFVYSAMPPTIILEFPSNLGLKEPAPGYEPGVRKLPSWLKQYGFHEQINASDTLTIEPPPYSMHLDKTSGVRNADAIIQYAKEQAALTGQVIADHFFPLVLGGDCSILIGSALALKKSGRYGLFFLDGHHDFMWPPFSQSGGAAGMDTAIVTGHGHDKLTNIDQLKPYFREEDVWCVGNREYDPTYTGLIEQSSVNYIDLALLRQQGTAYCTDRFLASVETNKLDGFWIHLDVDVLDDQVMPAVDSRTEDGISYDELDQLLIPLLRSEKAAGLEITILDPDLDPDGIYTQQFVERFCNMFNSSGR
jgi:arginase